VSVEDATNFLMRALVVHSEATSSVLTVTCVTTSPQLSADLVNAFIDEALAAHQAVYSSDTSLAFLDQQVAQARSQLSVSEKTLGDYRLQCGIHDDELHRENLMQDLQDLQSQVSADLATVASQEGLKTFLEQELAHEKPFLKVEVERQPQANPSRARLEERVTDLRVELIELEKARDRRPQQIETERANILAKIETLEEEIGKTPEFLELGPAIVDQANPRYERLRIRLDEVASELVTLKSEAAKRAERLETVKSALIELEKCVPTLNFFESEAEQSKQRLDQFLAARAQVGVLDLLDQMMLINLRPLQRAIPPRTKSGPQRGKLVVLGGLFGFAAGIGFAFARANLGRRLKSPADVRRLLGLPLLGIVPEARLARRRLAGRATEKAVS
jgi:uncharacterized protein involved in exopolysaccharide biosynthesis